MGVGHGSRGRKTPIPRHPFLSALEAGLPLKGQKPTGEGGLAIPRSLSSAWAFPPAYVPLPAGHFPQTSTWWSWGGPQGLGAGRRDLECWSLQGRLGQALGLSINPSRPGRPSSPSLTLLPLPHFPQGRRQQMSGEGSLVDAVKWGDCCYPEDGARRKWKFNRSLITRPAGRPAPLSGSGRAWVRAG